MSNVDVVQFDFGLIDFLMQKMTFTSQDCLRLLIEKVGDLNPFYIELDKGSATALMYSGDLPLSIDMFTRGMIFSPIGLHSIYVCA
ncbi:MAG: hypothetical protein V9G21_10255 [Methylotenera sp.]|nr:hypothetical protein [Methylotenera sp.]